MRMFFLCQLEGFLCAPSYQQGMRCSQPHRWPPLHLWETLPVNSNGGYLIRKRPLIAPLHPFNHLYVLAPYRKYQGED